MTMQTEGRKTRRVKGQPGLLEVEGAYRPVKNAGGPFILDQGPNGGRETPRMTESMPYLSHAEHMRTLVGEPQSAKIKRQPLKSAD